MFSAVTRDLTVSFAGRPALTGVSLSLPARGLSVIAGPSGSGKSTFLRTLNRLNDELGAETQGRVLLDFGAGLEEIYGPGSRPAAEIRTLAGMVFQQPGLLPASIWKNMALPLIHIRGISKSELAGRLETALKTVGLWAEVENRLNHPAATLSGGQQQRLCLARLLSLEPKILLIDEPTASLDILAADTVEAALMNLAEQYPIIMVTHSLPQAWRLADSLHCFHRGRFIRRLHRHEIKTERDFMNFLQSFALPGLRPGPSDASHPIRS